MKKKKKIQLDRLLLSRDPQSQEVFFFFQSENRKRHKTRREPPHRTKPRISRTSILPIPIDLGAAVQPRRRRKGLWTGTVVVLVAAKALVSVGAGSVAHEKP